MFELARLFDAMISGDQVASAQAATDYMGAAYKEGIPEDFLRNVLHGKLVAAVHAVQPPAPAASCTTAADPADAIDWYPPDPNRFYTLDKRSGIELAEVLDDLRVQDRYLKRGARAPNRLLFIGAPGNGKTAGGLWLGSQLGVEVGLLRIDNTVGSAVGEIAKNARHAFEAAWEKKALLLIDEFEAIAVPRSNQSANVGQWSRETTSALLQLLDSLPAEQIVIGATNHIGLIDGAVQRRMRKHVYFHPPDRDARHAMLTQWWGKAPHHGDAKRVLLDLTEGFSGDMLERIAEESNRAAARRAEIAPITELDVKVAVQRALTVETTQAAL
jgi:SpoVK/Ycf46/Vps4 family AAA+-type ATPase